MMTATEIRAKFLEFFASKGHQVVASSPLVPREDPTLLFTNAGMVQFKKVFLGQDKPGYVRATTSQKCLRVGGKHNDLENVGRTARHHTFFEMLGNFSFGDYFKEDAITFAWEFLTEVIGLDKSRLYATVYLDDDEAHGLWKKIAGLSDDRIFRLGDKDNFWSMGDTGPCGPCSEIMYDRGEEVGCGPNCGIGKCDCDRYLEIWNLVFMQYDQIEPGNRVSLPRPSIDTGMGLERIAAVVQGVHSNFDIDLFQAIIASAATIAGVTYGDNDEHDTALRVIGDHSRSVAFLLADGVMPSNEGRGYVLRRLIRRALRFGKLIGLSDPFLYKTAGVVVDVMGEAFPELVASREFMERVVREEEERFGVTLDKGLAILAEELDRMTAAGETVITGDFAFKLYDTYGFPLDIVNDVAGKRGITADEDGYKASMAEQKARAKKAWKGSGETDPAVLFLELLESGMKSRFVGYDQLTAASRVNALISAEGLAVERLVAGETGYMVCAVTPFYGESGGQAGDVGKVTTLTGDVAVLGTIKAGTELTAHHIEVKTGEILLDQEAELAVDAAVRAASARNHTCTHLLHKALKNVLGGHVNQAGSLVTPDRLRFDFSHVSAMTAEELSRVEDEVNAAILLDAPVVTEVLGIEAARAKGATALFGEKYGDEVRVVDVQGVSMELCGGTHIKATGQAGSFYILSESGVAAGTRRIEAVTGVNAINHVRAMRGELDETLKTVKAKPGELAARVKKLLDEIKALGKDKEQLAAKLASGQGRDLMAGLEEVNGVPLLCARVDAPSVKALREAMDDLRSKLPSGVIAIAAEQEGGKVSLIVAVSKDLHARFTAPVLIKDAAVAVGGSGGGRPDMAQAGGTNPAGIDEALAKVKAAVAGE
ncbi:alanine--tRNA ligase [Desulfovibrio sp. TomC]|uniref:alanine--tRNA ligase n=1 Tax=Desulfovibrio sp. TomC TaxID=1562888 RepID=UPI0005748AB6|nr:alanine--tRNA ligase [Desulfovibrio sp. TomC]KHK01423.1 Alanyl-tRNA synthetase [Desulfovibrio sp. TomC]